MKTSTMIFLYSLVFIALGESTNGLVLKSPWIYISVTPFAFLMAGFFIGVASMERSRGR